MPRREPINAAKDDPARQSLSVRRAAAPRPVVARRGGDEAATADPVAVVRRVATSTDGGAQSLMLRLQRRYGNAYVARLVDRAQADGNGGDPLGHVERSIDQARGGGNALDGATLDRMNDSFGADFSGVRVHTGGDADQMNRAVDAKAFTTGKDIFFREGAYQPGSTEGRGLLAHELTHVVQQTGDGVQMKLEVSDPSDPAEQEAEQVARDVMESERTTG